MSVPTPHELHARVQFTLTQHGYIGETQRQKRLR
jgi:hypothetical protein